VRVSTAQILLKTLDNKQAVTFLALLKLEADGKLLVKLSKYLRANEDIVESELPEKLTVGRNQFYRVLGVLGTALVSFLEGKSDALQLEGLFHVAKRLVCAVENEAAVDLIRIGIKAAGQVEEFHLVVRFWELVAALRTKPKIDGMDIASARKLRDNFNAYDSLLGKLEEVAQDRNNVHRKANIVSIQASDLLKAPEMALSKRATYYYWRLKALIHSLQRQYRDSIYCRENLLNLSREHPWIFHDPEYVLAKELSGFLQLLRLTNDSRYQNESLAFEGLEFRSIRAIQERDFFHFPASIAYPIQFGRTNEAISSIKAFLVLLAKRGSSFDSTYVSENLYICLYGAIATKQHDIYVSVSYHLQGYRKPDFKPKYYTMLRFIEIVKAMEMREWEDANRFIKNLRSSNGVDDLEGMREVLSFMSKRIVDWSQRKLEDTFKNDAWAVQELLQITNGLDLLDYFDLPAWFEAMEKGCPMMEIFHHRTRPI
jgi:hypothetical protein